MKDTITLKLGNNHTASSIELRQKEITLLLGDSTGANIHASLVHAERLLDEEHSGNILYINTVQTPWKIAESIRRALPEPEERYVADYYLYGEGMRAQPRIYFINSELGQLHREKEEI